MIKETDILTKCHQLKEMPYSTPEGYFEGIDERVMQNIRKGQSVSPFRLKLVPYLSAAAMLAVVAGIGFGVLKHRMQDEAIIDVEDYISYMTPLTEPESIYYSYNTAEESLTEEDIINYLIDSGISLETISNE